MSRILPAVTLILPFGLLSCTSKYAHKNAEVGMVAWNEDTVNPVVFKIHHDYTFEYRIRSNGKTHVAKGDTKYTHDTLYLLYKHDDQPTDMSDFLIREATGQYLIQLKSPGRPRIVMRIQGVHTGYGYRFWWDRERD